MLTANSRLAETRARQSLGSSGSAIYQMVVRALSQRGVQGDILMDVGCGTGALWPYVRNRFARYVGVDVVEYEGRPAELEFHRLDLDSGSPSLPDEYADVVVSVETIEHLENPRAFFRELFRLAKPGGWLVITTPNQLSALSLLTLLVKQRFSAFQDKLYPSHITALLEIDLLRIARECCVTDISVMYSQSGRIVLTPWHYPRFVSRVFPRATSDNVLIVARKSGSTEHAVHSQVAG
jgi:2-polyprenyl-3-methyl-5-hydroxy-6-metoxy-1,4-benzoquinol methylase